MFVFSRNEVTVFNVRDFAQAFKSRAFSVMISAQMSIFCH
jgi:hypothetical protein